MGIDHAANGGQRLLLYRVERLEVAHKEALVEIRDAVKSIDSSLRVLAEVQRRVEQLGGAEERLRAIEQELPTMKLARKWVLAAMTTMGGAVGAGVLALVVR